MISSRRISPVVLFILGNAVSMLGAPTPCQSFNAPPPPFQLISPPFAGIPAMIQLSDYYASDATIGTAQAVITGTSIDITQINYVAASLPAITCQVQTLDLGPLSPGSYNVIWTTVENIYPPQGATNTRVLTFAFSILPANAIPTAKWYTLAALAISAALLGTWRLTGGGAGVA